MAEREWKSKSKKQHNKTISSDFRTEDSSHHDYQDSVSSEDNDRPKNASMKKRNVTFNTNSQKKAKSKSKSKSQILALFSDSDQGDILQEDVDTYHVGGDQFQDKTKLLKKRPKDQELKWKDSNSNQSKKSSSKAERTNTSSRKGKPKLTDILSALKVANFEPKGSLVKSSVKKNEDDLLYSEIPTTDDIILTSDEETEKHHAPKENKSTEDMSVKQSFQDATDLFSPKKDSPKKAASNAIKKILSLDMELTDAKDTLTGEKDADIKTVEADTLSIVTTKEVPIETEVKFSKINIGDAPKKVENKVQQSTETKRKNTGGENPKKVDREPENEESRVSSAGSNSSSSSGAELYVKLPHALI